MKKTLCIFINYDKVKLHYYVKYYVQNLLKYCDDLIFVTNLNIEDSQITSHRKIKILSFKNEAYDFGFLYKAINSTDILKYDRLIFVNDSNIMFSSLDDIFKWGNDNKADYWGVTDSHETIPGYKIQNPYHIQSSFLVFEKRALSLIHTFFNDIRFLDFFDQSLDDRTLRLKIISKCEMGLSDYLIKKGLKVASYFSVENFAPKHINRPIPSVNLHIQLWKELMDNGYPFIKKKIVNNGWHPIHEPKRNLPDFSSWKNVVKRNMKNPTIFQKIFSV